MLLDHLKVTDHAVAHLLPKRLVEVHWGAGAMAGTRTVRFLYEHLQGGWAVGSADVHPDTGALSLTPGALQTSFGWSCQADLAIEPLEARFDSNMADRCAEPGRVLDTRGLRTLPAELELQLVHALQRSTNSRLGTWSPDAPAARGAAEQMQLAFGELLFGALSAPGGMSPQAVEVNDWIAGSDSGAGSLTGAPVSITALEARNWAFLLTEAGVTQQEGLRDALRILDEQGTEAFCTLLPDATLSYLAAHVDSARQRVDFLRGPRYTVADYVDETLAFFSDVLVDRLLDGPVATKGVVR